MVVAGRLILRALLLVIATLSFVLSFLWGFGALVCMTGTFMPMLILLYLLE